VAILRTLAALLAVVVGVMPALVACGTAPGPPVREAVGGIAGRPPAVRPRAAEPIPAPWGSSLRPVRIMPLGDSITVGRGDRRADGYRTRLGVMLTAAAVRYDFVGSQEDGTGPDRDHEGHVGWTIGEARGRVNGWLAAARPDIVLLDLGTNDMIRSTDPQVPAAALADLVDQILASSPDVRVVVATLIVPPTRGRLARPARVRAVPRTIAFNAAVRALAAARAPRVRVAEMAGVPWSATRDGVHPLPRGYRQMARQWFTELGPILAVRPAAGRAPFVRAPFVRAPAPRAPHSGRDPRRAV
jgi:lysophospholipase L1-like esterase